MLQNKLTTDTRLASEHTCITITSSSISSISSNVVVHHGRGFIVDSFMAVIRLRRLYIHCNVNQSLPITKPFFTK